MSTDYDRYFDHDEGQDVESLPRRYPKSPGKVTLSQGLPSGRGRQPSAPVESAPVQRATSSSVGSLPASSTGPFGSGYLVSELPAPTRSRMESAYSHSFGDVRVHENSAEASGSTHAVTRGRDLHFAPGRFAPDTAAGEWLIGHELAHVVQQARSSATPQGGQPFALAATLDPREVEADRAASAAVRGERFDIVLPAGFGQRQAYEAWEHRGVGDAHGGADRTVVTTNGVELTYGQICALSGDFYRSPEALMNAPAAELRAILAVMDREAGQAAAGGGRPSQDQINQNNADYEMATTGSERASHHAHSSFGGDEDDDEHHPGHGHGRVEDDEHVADAGPHGAHGTPDAEASFLGLADANASHFSPENIKNNYKPKHQLALDLAKQAWQERNPNSPAPAAMSAGTGASARTNDPGQTPLPGEGAAPSTGVAPSGTPAPASASPTPTAGGRSDVNAPATGPGARPGERKEAMAWLSDGFSVHYLTDAFAGGHLVSGNVGRTSGQAFYSSHSGTILAALAVCIQVDYPTLSFTTCTAIAAAMAGIASTKAGSLGLKIIHDQLNQSGVEVKNAKGTEWRTLGDASLAGSPQTRAQAELSNVASRNSVQDVLDRGTTDRGFEALDYIPDVARLGDGAYQPIATFAEDVSTFDTVYSSTMLPPSPGANQLYQLIKGNIQPMATLYLRRAGRAVQQGAERVGRGILDVGRSIWNWGGRQVDRAANAGRRVAAGARRAGEAVWQWGSDRVDDARDLGHRAATGARELGHRAATGARATGEAIWNWGSDRVDQVRRGARVLREGAGNALSEARRNANQVVANARRRIHDTVVGGADAYEQRQREDQPAQLGTGEEWIDTVDNQTYAHGGFMGAAGQFMQDARWNRIFAALMPAEHSRASRLHDVRQLMTALENNPVLAAYGSARHLSEIGGQEAGRADPGSGKPLPLEWDVFLDPNRPGDLSTVRIAHGNLGTTSGLRTADDPASFARSRAEVANAPSGGRWMELFGRAIQMFRGGSQSESDPGQATRRDETTRQAGSAGTAAAAIAIARDFLRPPGGLIIDVKSTYSTAEDVQAFVDAVQAAGVHVIGVGTFAPAQLEGLEAGVRRVIFYNGLTDFESAITESKGQPVESRALKGDGNDEIMFNAGSLLTESREYLVAGETQYQIEQSALQRLTAAHRSLGGCHIGLYVQEPAVAPSAAQAIIELVNARPDLIDRGFAYGNVSGSAESNATGTGHGMQRWIDR